MKRINLKVLKSFRQYMAEMILIVLSVLLAFSLGELRMSYMENKKLETSLEFISKEIAQNQKYVSNSDSVHQIIIANIDTLLKSDEYKKIFTKENGFDYSKIYYGSYFNNLLSSDAWQIANNNRILDKMDISDVIVLSRAYEQQKFVLETVFDISKLLHSESVFDKSKTEVNCKMLRSRFQMLHGLEMRLLYNYKTAQEVLEKYID